MKINSLVIKFIIGLYFYTYSESTKYYGYDIHKSRIGFLNQFFKLQGAEPLCKIQDISFEPPKEKADIALFLKEFHRFEKFYKGRTLNLIKSLNVSWIVISFPTISLHGGRSLSEQYRQYLYRILQNETWYIKEITFNTEIVFCINKGLIIAQDEVLRTNKL